MPTFEFRLYVAGARPPFARRGGNLRALWEASVPDDHAIEVIDVLERPEAAEKERVLATPTVVRLAPLPRRRVIGDLSDRSLAAIALEIPEPHEKPDERARWT